MAAQTARACWLLDRQWTPDDVTIIPSDSDSNSGTDSGDEAMDSVPHVNLLRDQHIDDSLPSISAIVASVVKSRRDPMEGIESLTQELCVTEEGESSDPSSLCSPAEVLFALTVLESPSAITDSDLLVSLAIQQHDDTVSPGLSTAMRGPRVASAASQCISAQPIPIVSLSDKVLPQQRAESSDQARLSSSTNLMQPSQPRSRSIVSSDRCSWICNTNDDDGHMDGIVPQSDKPHGVAQQALTKTHLSGCCPVSLKGSSTEVNQQHQVADDILPLVSYLSPLPNSLRRGKERHTSTNTYHTVSQLDGPCKEME
ncbi:protein-tyrosine phosphatase [Pochonia chlamydosporia 170]|uniref:Protein-tyrosine phosphatase n=1 Tax=Pochonia chlamydosporia 170 TaxID=1380566 RepID=A0A219ARW4_METCM|nr:protein-tyrosine phosphatase [Pochonia chlamydosporia 170]OWT43382.1 protein-tyrosine phosphatase [Pochonia chlamydosporia 170]